MIDAYAQITGWQIVAGVGVVVAAGGVYGEVRAALARHAAPLWMRETIANLRGTVQWQYQRDRDRLREIAALKAKLGDAQGGAAVVLQALAGKTPQEQEASR